MSAAGYLNAVYIGGVSIFYVMILAQSFFGSGNYAIVGPYMAEVWPSKLRASGMGLGYGFGNLGKFIGPAGLAVIAGSNNFVTPKATLDALIPAMNYFGFWYLVAAAAIWFIGIETKGLHDRGDRQHVDRVARGGTGARGGHAIVAPVAGASGGLMGWAAAAAGLDRPSFRSGVIPIVRQ